MSNTITIEVQNNNYWGANTAISAPGTANPALRWLYLYTEIAVPRTGLAVFSAVSAVFLVFL